MNNRETVRSAREWDERMLYSKLAEFAIDKGRVPLHPAEFPQRINAGGLATMTELLARLTLADGSLDRRKERMQQVSLNKTGNWVYSPVIVGEQLKIGGGAARLFQSHECVVFSAHSHPLPVVLAPTDLLMLRLPAEYAPLAMSVGTEHGNCFVFRSSDTKPLFEDPSLTRAGTMGPFDFVRVLAKFAGALKSYIDNDLLDSLTEGEKQLMREMSKKPQSFWQDTTRVEGAAGIYGRFLRDEAQRQGLVVYMGSPADSWITRVDLSKPISFS